MGAGVEVLPSFGGGLEAREEGLLFFFGTDQGLGALVLKPNVGSWVGLALAPGPLVWSPGPAGPQPPPVSL